MNTESRPAVAGRGGGCVAPGGRPRLRRRTGNRWNGHGHSPAGPRWRRQGPAEPGADVLETALVSARAPAADGVARQELLDRLARLDLGTPRATADRLEGLLASGALSTLRGRQRAVGAGGRGGPAAASWATRSPWRSPRRTSRTGAPSAPRMPPTAAGSGSSWSRWRSCLSLWGVAEPPRSAGIGAGAGHRGDGGPGHASAPGRCPGPGARCSAWGCWPASWASRSGWGWSCRASRRSSPRACSGRPLSEGSTRRSPSAILKRRSVPPQDPRRQAWRSTPRKKRQSSWR